MIKVTLTDNYDSSDSYEKVIDGNLPNGIARIYMSHDGGRAYVEIDDKEVLNDPLAGDHSLSEQGVTMSIDRGRFSCYSEDFEFYDVIGNDFNIVFEQVK